jgi:outer membrane protein assembly factor BamA
VTGSAAVYREALRYRSEEEELVYVPSYLERGLATGVDLPFGRTDVLVASHGAYNRVEGLAIALGPRVRFSGSHTTMAQALLIARTATASELDARRFGFDIRAEQLIERELGITIGAQLFSLIAPIEEWSLPDREAALAAFVLRRDYRDHYEREGWSGYARLARPGYPYSITLEYRDEEHTVVSPADPFTLLNRNDEWRPQPLVAEGALRSVSLLLRYDTRNEQRDPSAGWLLDAALERGLGGGITIPLAPAPGEDIADARSGFLTTRIDVRRYARLAPYSRLNLRIVAMGSLDARALPPQRQHTLGGEGSLPGYRLFAFDCGARTAAIERGGQSHYPYYGCDRLALIQLEYQAGFPFGRRLGQRAGLGSLAHLARWVAFFDAGRAWIEPAARRGRPGGNDDFSVDAGLGIRFGPIGVYWAVPISGRAEEVNFFVRVEPRI